MSSPTMTPSGPTREGTRIILREITATLHNSSSIQTLRRKSGPEEANPDPVKCSHEHEVRVRFTREFAEVAEVAEVVAENNCENVPENAAVVVADSRPATVYSSPPEESLSSSSSSSASGSFQSLTSAKFSTKNNNVGVQRDKPSCKLNGYSANNSYINAAIPGIEDLILGCADIRLTSEEEEKSFSTLQDYSQEDISQDQTFASATDEQPPLNPFNVTAEKLICRDELSQEDDLNPRTHEAEQDITPTFQLSYPPNDDDSFIPCATDLPTKKSSPSDSSHSITKYETCDFPFASPRAQANSCATSNDEFPSKKENSGSIDCPTSATPAKNKEQGQRKTGQPQTEESSQAEAKEPEKAVNAAAAADYPSSLLPIIPTSIPIENEDLGLIGGSNENIDDSERSLRNLSSRSSSSPVNDAIRDIFPLEFASPIIAARVVSNKGNENKVTSSPSPSGQESWCRSLSTVDTECTDANRSTGQTTKSPAISPDNSPRPTTTNVVVASPLTLSQNQGTCNVVVALPKDVIVIPNEFAGSSTVVLENTAGNIEKVTTDNPVTVLEISGVTSTEETVDAPLILSRSNVGVSIEQSALNGSTAIPLHDIEQPHRERSLLAEERGARTISAKPSATDTVVEEEEEKVVSPTNLDDTITLEDVCPDTVVVPPDEVRYTEFKPQRQSTTLATAAVDQQFSFAELKLAAQEVANDIYNSSLVEQHSEETDRFASCEIFQDPTSFDFLLARSNSGKNTVRDLRAESLYVKFDPLVGNVNMLPQGNNNQTISEEEDRKPSVTPPVCDEPTTPKRNPAIAAIDRLLFYSPLLPPPPPPSPGSGADRKSTEFQEKNEAKPADASGNVDANMTKELEVVRSTVLQLEEELEKQKKEHQVELERQKNAFQEKLDKLQTQLAQELKNKNQMTVVMDEYEKSISRLVSERERDRASLEQEKSKLQEELQAANHHLNNTEAAFNDVHLKYERLKGVVSAYKSNETVLKESIQENVETIKALENRYDQLKSHAMAQLEKANLELDAIKKQHEAEIVKLHAMVRKAELKSNSLAELVEQKTKENKELTQILDEVIARVGRQSTE